MKIGGRSFLTYSYIPGGRLETLTRGPKTLGLEYDGGGRGALATCPNDVDTVYTCQDPLGRLAGIEASRAGIARSRALYAYDAVGNRTTEPLGQAPQQASHDVRNRLLGRDAGGNLKGAARSTSRRRWWSTASQRACGKAGCSRRRSPHPGHQHVHRAGHRRQRQRRQRDLPGGARRRADDLRLET